MQEHAEGVRDFGVWERLSSIREKYRLRQGGSQVYHPLLLQCVTREFSSLHYSATVALTFSTVNLDFCYHILFTLLGHKKQS